jgi:hypothetical protein
MNKGDWQNGMVGDLLRRVLNFLSEVCFRVFDFLVEQRLEQGLSELLRSILSRVHRSPDGVSLRLDTASYAVSLSLDIASYADCKEFRDFTLKHERRVTLHF